MFVLHRGEIFAQTSERKQFSPSAITAETDRFIYEILSKELGKKTSWKASVTMEENSSCCFGQKENQSLLKATDIYIDFLLL